MFARSAVSRARLLSRITYCLARVLTRTANACRACRCEDLMKTRVISAKEYISAYSVQKPVAESKSPLAKISKASMYRWKESYVT